MVHLHDGMLLSVGRNGMVPLPQRGVDLEDTVPTEMSQSDKDKYHVIPLQCGISGTS